MIDQTNPTETSGQTLFENESAAGAGGLPSPSLDALLCPACRRLAVDLDDGQGWCAACNKLWDLPGGEVGEYIPVVLLALAEERARAAELKRHRERDHSLLVEADAALRGAKQAIEANLKRRVRAEIKLARAAKRLAVYDACLQPVERIEERTTELGGALRAMLYWDRQYAEHLREVRGTNPDLEEGLRTLDAAAAELDRLEAMRDEAERRSRELERTVEELRSRDQRQLDRIHELEVEREEWNVGDDELQRRLEAAQAVQAPSRSVARRIAIQTGQPMPTFDGHDLPVAIHLSNKHCPNCYAGAKDECPPGRCWYDEQRARQARGEQPVTYPKWLAELAKDKATTPKALSGNEPLAASPSDDLEGDVQPCGHRRSEIVFADEGTVHCAGCERDARNSESTRPA